MDLNFSERKLIVGIDFGTTYSGVAWAETKRPDRLTAVTTWPISKLIAEGESSDKVPTKLRYTPGGGDEPEWGFAISATAPNEEVIEWFKLDLDPSIAPQDRSKSKDQARQGRGPDQLVADYMSLLGNHLMYTMREKLGKSVVESIPMEFVVTVPAIWSELAKEKTRLAFLRAPIIGTSKWPVHLVSEPEAAALYALNGMAPHRLKIGNTIIVVDAGGGTVDLISYTIVTLDPTLEIEEAAPGSGGLCGSTYLNQRFAKFLKAKLGKLDGFDDEVMSEAMEIFEKKVKRHFTTNTPNEETFIIPVGGLSNDKELGINRGRYALKASDVRVIFEPVVQEVVKLVKEQIAATKTSIRAVLLVGGFGASSYLKESLRHVIKKETEIMQPPKAWQAVVQGAVMKGLANIAPEAAKVAVRNRKARRSYGVQLDTAFNDTDHGHLDHDKYWDAKEEIYRVSIMQWFVKRGEQVSEKTPSIIDYSHWNPVSSCQPKMLAMDIYSDYANRKLKGQVIQRDEHVRQLSKVQGDISHIPESHLPRKIGKDGITYYKFSCQIRAVFQSASTRYSLWYDGKEYDTITCEYV